MATYARPCRRWVPVLMRGHGVHRVIALAVLLAALGAIADTATDDAAIEHAVARYDAVDAARAAEQLADAQDHAARLEAAAIERAREEVARDDQARELMHEARSTGEALRDVTGQ